MFEGAVIITGGSSGIGKALAARLLKGGAKVAICGRDYGRLEAAIQELQPDAAHFLAVQADVTYREQTKSVVEQTLAKWGRVDALVNSAGVGFLGSITDTPDAKIEELLATNIKGALITSQEVWQTMTTQKAGHIVNLCGILGVRTIANAALYCATKHALVGMSGALAAEGKRAGIRVTSVCCSGVDSPFWDGVPGKPRTEMLLTPDEVAQSIADVLNLSPHVIPNQILVQHILHQM